MFTGMTTKKLIKLKAFVNAVVQNFMNTRAILNEGNFARTSVPTLLTKNLKLGFAHIAKNRIACHLLIKRSAVLWNVGRQDRKQKRGRQERNFLGNVFNAVKSFGRSHLMLRSLAVNFVLGNARLILKEFTMEQTRVFTAQVFGFRFENAFSSGTIKLAKCADLVENIFMSTIRNLSETVVGRKMKISSLYVHIAT